jgi:signal transduction histidine kinase
MTLHTAPAEDLELKAQTAYELREPLALIHGYIETLGSGIIHPGPSMQHCLEVMARNSRRMIGILDDMLTLSRLESTDPRLKIETLHLKQCISDVLDHLRPLLKDSMADIRVSVVPNDCSIRGDRFCWDQVFTHLIEGALQAAHGGPLVITVRAAIHRSTCRLTFTDDGHGIPLADYAAIFPLRPGHPPTPNDLQTTSLLGLRLVQQVVRLHQGTVRLRPASLHGTHFEIEVPC